MTGPNDFVRERTVNEHFSSALNQRLDLRLPLFGPDETGCRQHGQNFLRTGRAPEQFIERAAGGNAFAAFTSEDDEAVFLNDARGGAHAFDTLVKTQVQRIAA